MNALWSLLRAVFAFLQRKEKSSDVIDGFERLTKRFEEFAKLADDRHAVMTKKLNECDADRDMLRSEAAQLRSDIDALSAQLNRHSLEYKRSLGISGEPQPPRRTTRKHFTEPEEKKDDQ